MKTALLAILYQTFVVALFFTGPKTGPVGARLAGHLCLLSALALSAAPLPRAYRLGASVLFAVSGALLIVSFPEDAARRLIFDALTTRIVAVFFPWLAALLLTAGWIGLLHAKRVSASTVALWTGWTFLLTTHLLLSCIGGIRYTPPTAVTALAGAILFWAFAGFLWKRERRENGRA